MRSGTGRVAGLRGDLGKENQKAKALLDRLVAMLTKLGRRGYAVGEELGEYRTAGTDAD